MKNVSNEFRNIISKGGPFYAYARITLANGTELELNSNDDFSSDGNGYSESGGGGFPLGVAMAKTIEIAIENLDGRFSDYDFYGAKIVLYTEADVNNGTERIEEGTFTVIDAVAPGEAIEISASDDMYKSDRDYVCNLNPPFTTGALLRDVCSQCDISLGSASFVNDDFVITEKPTGITCRQAIGYVAQIAAGNAVIDERSKLQIKTYNFPSSGSWIISGGEYQDKETDILSGGSFGDQIKSVISGGKFKDSTGICVLSEFSSDLDIAVDDVTITGISVNVEGAEDQEESTLLYGTDEYALVIKNPLISGSEETAISLIGDILIGLRIRPFSGEFFPDPTIQFMDPAYLVDKNDNVYQTFITDNSFDYLGGSNLSNDTPSPERNRSSYSGSSTQIYNKLKSEINKSRTEWEKAVEGLENDLKNSSGLYETSVVQPDGSTIYYFHDKKTIEESQTIIKITDQALGVSTDGGETYPVGLRFDGEAIVKILQTIGINADWINSGALKIVKDGETIFNADIDTGTVEISGNNIIIGDRNATDVINEANKNASDALKEAQNSKAILLQLDNEYQGIPTDKDGNYTTFPECKTTAVVFFGNVDITNQVTFTTTKSQGVVGSWNNSSKTYTVTGLSTDTGWVDIKATYLNALSVTKRFTITKQKQGEQGVAGVDGNTYILEPSVSLVKLEKGNAPHVDRIVFNSYIRKGDNTSREVYKGRFKIEETEDGIQWRQVYLSTQDENEVEHFLNSALVNKVGQVLKNKAGELLTVVRSLYSIRCTLYAAGGTSELIDIQEIPVIRNVNSFTQDEVFDILTDNGAAKGLYKVGNQLYISFTYAKGGTLVLGGIDNVHGVLEMRNENDEIVGKWDKDGINANGSIKSTRSDGATCGLGSGGLEFYFPATNGYNPCGANWSLKESEDSSVIMLSLIDVVYPVEGDGPIKTRTIKLDTGESGVDGTAQFSDGSYLRFKNGRCVGGMTADGVEF